MFFKKVFVFIYLIHISFFIHGQFFQWINQSHSVKNGAIFGESSISGKEDKLYSLKNFADTLFYKSDTILGIKKSSVALICLNKMSSGIVWKKIISCSGWVNGISVKHWKDKVFVYGTFTDSLFAENDTLIVPPHPSFNKSLFLSVWDTAGNYVYSSFYGLSVNYEGEDMIVGDSGIYLSGYTYNDVLMNNFSDTIKASQYPALYLIRINKLNYQYQWGKAGGMYYVQAGIRSRMSMDSAQNVYVTGHFQTLFNFGTYTINNALGGPCPFLMKIHPNGTVVYLKRLTSSTEVYVMDHIVSKNKVYMTGSAYIKADFTTDTVNALNYPQYFILEYDTTGSEQKLYKSLHKTTRSQGNTVHKDPAGNIYFSITFTDSLSFIGKDLALLSPSVYVAFVKWNTDTIIRYIRLARIDNMTKLMEDEVDERGNYYITAYSGRKFITDTILYAIASTSDYLDIKISCKRQPPKLFASDTSICWHQQSILSVYPKPFWNVVWSNGSTDTSIVVNQGGYYSVYYEDENGCQSDAVGLNITAFPRTIIPIQQLCDSIYTSGINGNWYFNGQLVQQGSYVNNVLNGVYHFQSIDNNGCITDDSLFVQIDSIKILLENQCGHLIATVQDSLYWYMNGLIIDTAQSIIVQQSGN